MLKTSQAYYSKRKLPPGSFNIEVCLSEMREESFYDVRVQSIIQSNYRTGSVTEQQQLVITFLMALTAHSGPPAHTPKWGKKNTDVSLLLAKGRD